MQFNAACLINIFLAFLALYFYIIGSHRFYKNKSSFIFLFGLAIGIDILTAVLASFKITPTTQVFESAPVPWYSLLFKIHVIFSMIGFLGFIILFIYLLLKQRKAYSEKIRKWQFTFLLPVWIIGESIALTNAISKLFFQVRIFDAI